jgi:hypothetical protein
MSRRKVEVMYFDGCPNVDRAVDQVRVAIAMVGMEGSVDVTLTRVSDEVAAGRKGFLGSPTVLVDGRDVEPDAVARDACDLQCRVYWNDGHLQGAPPSRWIAAALAAAPGERPGSIEPAPSGSTRQSEHDRCNGEGGR